MNRLLLSMLLIAGLCGIVFVPYDKIWSAETLSPSSAASTASSIIPLSITYGLPQHNEIAPDNILPKTTNENVDDVQPIDANDRSKNEDSASWGLHVPVGLTENSTLVRRTNVLVKHGVFRGTLQMDCKAAPMVCKNAAYFQNCLQRAGGNKQQVVYRNGSQEDTNDTPEAGRNRYNSGVSTGWATPCLARPFAQMFIDH
jgi:hypothetical protein